MKTAALDVVDDYRPDVGTLLAFSAALSVSPRVLIRIAAASFLVILL